MNKKRKRAEANLGDDNFVDDRRGKRLKASNKIDFLRCQISTGKTRTDTDHS